MPTDQRAEIEDDDLLISVAQAAKRCSLGESTIRSLIDRGLFPFVQLPGIRRKLIPVKALEK